MKTQPLCRQHEVHSTFANIGTALIRRSGQRATQTLRHVTNMSGSFSPQRLELLSESWISGDREKNDSSHDDPADNWAYKSNLSYKQQKSSKAVTAQGKVQAARSGFNM